MNLTKAITDIKDNVAIDNLADMIKRNFEDDYKTVTPSVLEKMNNTIKFINSNYRIKEKNED